MRKTSFIELLNNPLDIKSQDTEALESLISNYPYFQSAKTLYLKGLKNQNSFRYNKNLKLTAASTTDRAVLFDFITSQVFNNFNQEVEENQTIEEITKVDQKVENQLLVEPDLESNVDEIVEVESNDSDILEESTISENLNFELAESKDQDIDNSVQFNKNELYTFNEWLQLTSFKPIDRSVPEEEPLPLEDKMELIDEFIVKNPRISPVKNNALSPKTAPIVPDSEDIMTETLARVYVLQHKYNDAINAYEILSLKYPEKSSLFADQIKNIQVLKKIYNKNKP